MGFVVGLVVHSATIQDRDGAKILLQKIRHQFPELEKMFADGAYGGKLEKWVEAYMQCTLEIVKRCDTAAGFEVLPKRWIVERTFAWLSRYRRLSKDYEYYAQTGENFVYMAMINLMLHRLAPEARNHNYLPKTQAVAA